MPIDINKILLYKKNFSNGLYKFCIESTNDNIILTVNEDFNIINNYKFNFFVEKLFKIVDMWEENYINNEIVDASEWQLLIKFHNGHSRLYNGKGDFPINFDAFEELINELIESNIGD